MKVELLIAFSLAVTVTGSNLGVSLGDSAVSQILRHAAGKLMEKTRVADILLKTKEEPTFGPIANLELLNNLSYSNFSVHFHKDIVHVYFEKLKLQSQANFSEVLWPLAFSDSLVDSYLKVDRGHLRFAVENQKVSLSKCAFFSPDVSFHLRDSWIINKGMSALSSTMTSLFESLLCTMIESSTVDVKHDIQRKFPIYEILPKKIQEHMSARNTTLFYRVKSIEANEHEATVRAQIEWQQMTPNDDVSNVLEENMGNDGNSTIFDVEVQSDDVATVWIEDAILNEILDQVDWNFEWMNEQIPVSSPIIPPDSREFLSTLCTDCFFQVNVNAKGRPTISATNESLVLTKTDRIHLQVVNPAKNVTSVFVSLVLTIQAQLQPSFDNGIMRTAVELLDTGIEMEKGAFPKSWGFFMGDLIRGMIMDMMWPELKSIIEDLTYGKGLRISSACGIDPNRITVDIGEGNFAVSTRLVLQMLDPERCLSEMKNSLPNASKLLKRTSKR